MKIDVSSGATLLPNDPINNNKNSAILVLVKKMVSVIGGMIDLPWHNVHSTTEDNTNSGIIEELLSFEKNEHLGMAAGLLSDVFLPYLSPMLKIILPSFDDYENGYRYYQSRSNANRIDSQEQLISCTATPEIAHVKDNNSTKESGLILPIPEVLNRLDYVITQMDISRMKRTASRSLDQDSVHRLPTVIYGSELICPAYEEGAENEGSDINDGLSGKDDSQVWSWMVVPRNTSEEISRISGTNWSGIPESISICSSSRSMGLLGETGQEPVSSFDVCVICKERFLEGDRLRVLPCEHRFHCTCSCFNKILNDAICRCPMCKKNDLACVPPCSSSLHIFSKKKSGVAEKVETLPPSDGSVPSWAFVRLGSLLSSKGS